MQAPSIDAPSADWLVYGDSLQEAGDPRGELIGLSHAVAEGKTTADVRDAYVKEHAKALLGEAAPFLETYRFDWRFCLPLAVTVRIGANDGDRMLALLRTPLAAELRAITLVGHTDARAPVSLAPAMKELELRRPPALRSFTFVDERASKASMLISTDYEPPPNLVSFGSIVPFFAFAEEIQLDVADSHQLELSPMAAPELRAFTLKSLRFADYDSAAVMLGRLAEAKLPKLERYAVRLTETWFTNIAAEDNPYLPVYSEREAERVAEAAEEGEERENRYETEADEGDTEGIDWNGEIGALLELLAGCPLKHLALTAFNSSRTLIEAIDRVGLAPTLETLDLSDSSLGDEDATWIASRPARFAGLKKIIAERTSLSDAGIKTLKKLGPEIVASRGTNSYRYVVGSE
ncbi:MAG: hypothetical protein M4D80_23600 [Myxococcota bacterium]|nr:hypothetical protein [Myxococcota bacterium]